MRRDYSDLPLAPFADASIYETEQAAIRTYNAEWNYYSNALRREVVSTFQKSIETLLSSFETIDYLEIGSAQGLSMGVIACMLRRVRRLHTLLSIDPYYEDGYTEGGGAPQPDVQKVRINKATRDKALGLYRSLGLSVSLLERQSSSGLKELLSENRQFHLIYIDGSHEGLNPTIDFGLCHELVHKGGIIMLDDHYWEDVIPIRALCDRHATKIAECWKVAAYQIAREQSH
ncbi:MAG: class I SAM-dependent methyltransferase [Phycisphaerae bacterium]|nr:class I SAM-dependent methyltransferase [Phycisphaerae bacterium]